MTIKNTTLWSNVLIYFSQIDIHLICISLKKSSYPSTEKRISRKSTLFFLKNPRSFPLRSLPILRNEFFKRCW